MANCPPMPIARIVLLVLWSCLNVGIFFGFLFGLLVPDIEFDQSFIESVCTPTERSFQPYRACSKSCSYCETVYSAQSCDYKLDEAYEDRYDGCAFNTTTCPTSESKYGGACSDGAKCCREVCRTCSTCRRNLQGGGSSRFITHLRIF